MGLTPTEAPIPDYGSVKKRSLHPGYAAQPSSGQLRRLVRTGRGKARRQSFDYEIHRRQQEQGHQRRHQEASGYDCGEAALHVAAYAGCHGGRQHADGGDGRGHEDWPQALARAGHYSLHERNAEITHAIEVCHHDDPIHDGDSEQRNEPDTGGHVEGDTGDMQRNQPAERRERDDSENEDHLAQETEFRVEQHDHETEDQTKDQAEARLRALFALELPAPFEAVELRIEFYLRRNSLLRLRQQRWQASALKIEFHHKVTVIHIAIDRAFAGLQLDARDL